MNCKRASEIVFLFVDEEMEDDLLDPFRHHLAICPECDQMARYTRKLLLVVRRRCVRHLAPPRLRQRILTSLPHRNNLLQAE